MLNRRTFLSGAAAVVALALRLRAGRRFPNFSFFLAADPEARPRLDQPKRKTNYFRPFLCPTLW